MKINIFYDKLIYIITLFCIGLIIGLPVLFFFTFNDTIFSLITLAIGAIPLAIAALFAPRYYLVEKDEIIIKKIVGKIIICKDDIENVTIIDSEMVKGLFRKFASGGFLGYYGLFYSNVLKNINMYAGSSSKNLVLITLKSKKSYLITPKEMQTFTNTMTAYFENDNLES